MEFRLPRLRRDAAIVGKDGKPTTLFQRWWQSFIEKIEGQEATQDQMLADIALALEQAGIALDLAGAIMPDIPPVTINADYTGTVLPGQLPRNIAAQRFDNDTDVTTSSAWSATLVSGGTTFSIGASTGILNLTALDNTSVIEVQSEYNDIPRSKKVTITKALADPPPSSSSGTEYDSSIDSTTSTSYGPANAGPITITCGASGTVDLAAPLTMIAGAISTGQYDAYGKWQVSDAGAGVWSDVDTEIMSAVPCQIYSGLVGYEGYIEVNQQAGGLTPASDYDFRLLLRNAFASPDTMYYTGTASASTS